MTNNLTDMIFDDSFYLADNYVTQLESQPLVYHFKIRESDFILYFILYFISFICFLLVYPFSNRSKNI